MKKCSKCNNLLQLKFFYKDSTHKDGHRGQCNNCDKKYRLKNREKYKKNQKEYNLTHKKERKEYNINIKIRFKNILKNIIQNLKTKKGEVNG